MYEAILALLACLWAFYVLYQVFVRGKVLTRKDEEALSVMRGRAKTASPEEKALAEELEKAGVELSPEALAGIRLALSVGLAVLVFAFGLPPLLSAAGAAAGWYGPIFFLKGRARARMMKVEEDLPSALTVIAGSCALEESIPDLLLDAAKDLEAQGRRGVLSELLRKAALMARGQGEEKALAWLEQAAPSFSLANTALMLRIYALKGGEFAQVMEESAGILRNIVVGRARARAKAAGALTTARLLIGLVVFVALLGLRGDQTMRQFYSSLLGQAALVLLAGMMAAGYFAIKKKAEEIG